jgi:uncharacterized surface protein with fasciclin (FAS1) repeats
MNVVRNTLMMAACAALVLVPALAANAEACSSKSAKADIVDTAKAAGGFETLLAAAEAAGLVDALKSEGPLTVFAPTDEAFAKLPEGTIPALLEDKEKLASILKYHVVPGKVMAEDVTKVESATSLLGQAIPVSTEDGVTVAGANVIKTDIYCSNGVIHVVDSVMMPKNVVELAQSAGSFSTLLAAAEAAGLVDTLTGSGPFTIFAPTDAAFAALPEGTVSDLLKPENKDKLAAILTYHVVPGKVTASEVVGLTEAKTVEGSMLDIAVEKDGDKVTGVMVDNAKVVQTDIIGSNGVIHVIDAVVLPNA